MTPNEMRKKAKELEAKGGNRDQINKLLDDANDAEEAAYQKSGGGYGMKKGGKVKAKKPSRAMQAVAARAVKSHEKRMHKGMASGGSVRGDGCAVKGKTKGTMR